MNSKSSKEIFKFEIGIAVFVILGVIYGGVLALSKLQGLEEMIARTVLDTLLFLLVLTSSALFLFNSKLFPNRIIPNVLAVLMLLFLATSTWYNYSDSYYAFKAEVNQKRTVENFRKIAKGDTEIQVAKHVGPYDSDVGFGLTVYSYDMKDGSIITVSFISNDLGADSVLSVHKRNQDGSVEIFVE